MILAVERGELTWHAGSMDESGRLRAMRARQDWQENFSPNLSTNLEKTSLETILRVHTEISKIHESAILVDEV